MIRPLAFALAVLAAVGARAQDLAAEAEEARTVIQRLRGVMMEHLMTAMMESGPAGATQICRHLAPEIAAEIEAETGWEIRRTGFRVRNPENRPTDAERAILLAYAARHAAGQSMELMQTTRLVERDGRTLVEYFQAIPTLEPCLACHGAELAPEVAAAIRADYPEDEAVGFAAGDLRGIFSLRRPWTPGEEAAAPAAAAEPIDLPGEVPLGIGTLTGNAADGQALFSSACQRCHEPTHLAGHVFRPGGEPIRADVCVFLETHGITDAERDCDILAYLKTLAEASGR